MSLQVILNAMLLGGLYAFMGLGFSLQWGISKIINLSYGAMIILGSYISFEFYKLLQLTPFVSIVFSGIILFIIGGVTYYFLLEPLLKKEQFMFTLTVTFALGLIMENIMLVLWSADYRSIRLPNAGINIQLDFVTIPILKLVIFFIAILLMILVNIFMSKTKVGKGIQAVALSRVGSQAVGINVKKMYLLNFALGSALAGMSGSIWSSVYVFSPHLLLFFLSKVFIISIIGGLGNITGAAVGGLVLGFAETFGGEYLGAAWQEAIGMVIMIMILLFKPHGLFGKKFFI